MGRGGGVCCYARVEGERESPWTVGRSPVTNGKEEKIDKVRCQLEIFFRKLTEEMRRDENEGSRDGE